MQKKNIFITSVLALIMGFLGGGLSSVFLSSQVERIYEMPPATYVEESALMAAQQKVAPAVFSIVEYADLNEVMNDFFTDFSSGDGDGELTQIGGGTGFLIDASGVGITNKHVIADERSRFVAILDDGTQFDLIVEAIDPGNDLAIVRLVAEEGSEEAERLVDMPFVTLGSSADLQVGQHVFSIGNALAEYENTTTAGIISATGRKIVAYDGLGDTSTLYGLLQTDAAINPGNSGGPLVNLAGEVVGINTALDTEAEGIGFAIPIDDIKPSIDSWRQYGEIVRPMLGVRYVMVTPPVKRRFELDVSYGALLVADPERADSPILPGGPAEAAGLMEGDIILEVDGEELNLDYTLQDSILRNQVGDRVTLLVWREGETFEVIVELTRLVPSE